LRKSELGDTGIALSAIGLGTWALGGPGWAFGWGPQTDSDSIATIRRAVQLGIDWIDTAPIYGLGRAEEIVARALSEMPASERPRVFTKCGLAWKKRRILHRLKAESVRSQVEGSLARLRVEVLDLVQVHWPDATPGGPAPDLEEGWTALARLRQEGKIRHVGASNFDVTELERVSRIAPVASLQPPYSLLRRGIEEEILPYCLRRRIGVIVYSPLHSGLLTGTMTRERIRSLPDDDWRKTRSDELLEPRLSRNLDVVEALRRIGAARGRSPIELAIAWAISHPAVTGAIVGARRPDQLDEIARAAEIALTPTERVELDAVSPIRPS
jgi:aryl-alcohol dehydrogenase-like predicted oxidoreductase